MWDKIKTENLQFLLVDFQEKFFKILDRGHVDTVRRNILLLVRMFDRLGIPMSGTEHYVKGLGHTDSRVLEAWAGEPFSDKVIFSCCGDPVFRRRIQDQNRPVVVVAGLETHICVLQTTLDLLAAGFVPWLAVDGISGSDRSQMAAAMDRMSEAGTIRTGAMSAIYEILGDATHPRFREVLGLAKRLPRH